MSTISNRSIPNDTQPPDGERIWCGTCRTDEYLILDSMEPLNPPMDDLMDIAYICVECDTFHAHTTTSQDAAMVLNQRKTTPGVSQLDGG